MLCPSCHTQNRENARFCKGCGMSFTPEQMAAAGAVSQQEAPPAEWVHQATTPETSSPPAAQPTAGSPTQSAIWSANAVPAAPAAASTEEDLELAPTQILTPQQMLKYHARRWQQELDREQQAQQAAPQTSGDNGDIPDIADAPTLLFNPPEPATPTTQPEQPAQAPDISAQPTLSMTPPEVNSAPASLADAQVPSQTAASTPMPEDVPDEQRTTNQNNATAPSNQEELAAPEEESVMEPETPSQETPSLAEQSSQEQQEQQATTGDFPALAVGTTVNGRYEITQVVSDDAHEHIYHVIDHQGYQQCWNCGSKENAEGDEFCIDCGAELLNASYILHEYPASASPDSESHVLQGTIANTFVEQGHTYVVEQQQAAQIAFPNGVHLLVASDSDAGDVRRSEPNEDSTLVLQFQRIHESLASPVGIFMIADGMGGHANGQGASRMAIATIAERATRELLMPPLTTEKNAEQPPEMDEDSYVALLHGAIEDANSALCQANQRDKSDAGSTLTGFMLVGEHAFIFNVGDSRTYLLRDGKLHQVTNDHSLVGQLVASGLIEPDDVYTHPQRSQIYRSIGDKPNIQIDIFKQQVYPGDILLSCSDGLWEMVRNPQITDILTSAPDPQTACNQLIEAANANGGEDNVSAVIAFVR